MLERRAGIAGRALALAAGIVLAGAVAGCGHRDRDRTPVPVDLRTLRPALAFEGRIVFQSDLDGDDEIYLLTSDGVRKLTDNAWNDEFPKWSPDGTQIAFMANPDGPYQPFVMNADGGGLRPLGPRDGRTRSRIGFAGLAWSPDGGTIAFTVEKKKGVFRSYQTWALDVASDRIEKFLPWFDGQIASPNFSRTGPLVAFTGKKTIGWDVAVADLEARRAVFVSGGQGACRPHFAPDGRTVAYVSHAADGKGDIWLMDPDGTNKRRLTERDDTYDYFPGWSPDGRRVVFCSSPDSQYPYEGTWALWVVEVATKRATLLFDSPGRDVFPDWRE
jgi:Tol biopolymer transport system component